MLPPHDLGKKFRRGPVPHQSRPSWLWAHLQHHGFYPAPEPLQLLFGVSRTRGVARVAGSAPQLSTDLLEYWQQLAQLPASLRPPAGQGSRLIKQARDSATSVGQPQGVGSAGVVPVPLRDLVLKLCHLLPKPGEGARHLHFRVSQ